MMRQVARWYDVEVAFADNLPEDGFSGKISRSVPLKKLLMIMELNEIHYKMEGRKLTIMP